MKISTFFGASEKHILHWEIFSENRFDTTNAFLDMSWSNGGRKIAPVSIEWLDSEISSVLCSKFPIFSLHKCCQVSQCIGITLRAEGLYESYGISSWGRSTFPGAEPPAGPPEITKSRGDITFPKIREIQKLGARGKPSTIVYRAGWLVEPFFVGAILKVRSPFM